ncbi:MAG: HD domain-containing protein [Lachnospiraceae bacterium]|nr:HD domain-containing protein [Lachnospiraceae bacterium]
MFVSEAMTKMIRFYAQESGQKSHHDINHFQKVWAFAKTIGELEGLDAYTQETLELAAIVHDIACPLCREKYGDADGPHQELEGPSMARIFYEEMGLSNEQLERICFLVGHHHTLDQVDGMDYQVLLEADFLVNADESQARRDQIVRFRDRVYRTKTGIQLLNEIYGL